MDSYFKGWQSIAPRTPKVEYDEVLPLLGQVLEVYYKATDRTPSGTVKVKIYSKSDRIDEEEIITYAGPANINMIKYPVAGELVLLTVGITDNVTDGHSMSAYYYTTVLSSAGSVSYNSNPFYLNYIPRDKASVTGLLKDFFKESPQKRFEKTLTDTSRFIKKNKVIQRPQLRPFEGDLILQSRFNSTIRLGSTTLNDINPWSEFGSLAGSPITIMSLRNNISNVTEEITVIEDVDKDLATMALCTSQRIPVKLGISKFLKTFKHTYNVEPKLLETPESGSGHTAFLPDDWVAPPINAINTAGSQGSGDGGSGNNVSVQYSGAIVPGGMILPTGAPGKNYITSGYYRNSPPTKFHGALDIGGPAGTPIYAIADGIVISTQWEHRTYKNGPCPDASVSTGCGGGFGNYAVIYHPQLDLYSLYAHMIGLPLVKSKQTVKQGTQIGTMGNSGSSQGRHLHFEIKAPTKRGKANDATLTPDQQYKKAYELHAYESRVKLDIAKIGFYKVVDGCLAIATKA